MILTSSSLSNPGPSALSDSTGEGMDHQDVNVTSIYYDPYDYEIDADPHPV
jgi:hypothetical protein